MSQAVPSTTPSCKARLQKPSKSVSGAELRRFSRTSSYPDVNFENRNKSKDLGDRTSAVERCDQRLPHRQSSVQRSAISPGLESMGPRQVPGAALRCFVVIQAEVDRSRDIRQELAESKIGRCVVYRIPTEDQKGLD